MVRNQRLPPIVCFLDHNWERDSKRPHLEGVGAITRLLCVEPPFTPASPLIRRDDVRRALRGRVGLRRLGDTHWLYKPQTPFPYVITLRFPWLAPFNRTAMRWSLRTPLDRLAFEKPILMIAHPAHYYTIGMLDERLLCYEVYDEYTALGIHRNPALHRNQVRIERQILQRADIVFASARNLAESKSQQNPNTQFVPNTADVSFFAEARDPDTVVPADLDELRRPRFGLIGHINDILDVELIDYLAATHPHWSIVLIGALNGSAAFMRSEAYLKVRQQPNVHYMGLKPYETLPAYEKGLDVCLLPYLINDYTRNVYPSKLHQYLAGGKPVVSTALPEMLPFADVIYIADSHAEFVALCERALQPAARGVVEQRIAVARENSIEVRAELKVGLLRETLDRKGRNKIPVSGKQWKSTS